jgi:hypothetical protein
MKDNKWLAITCSRNDGDFIESFIRGNSRYIDKFVIVDDSSDKTIEILKSLAREGFDIEIIKRKGIVASQQEKTNWMFQKYATRRRYSAVIPLDVDEIIVPRSPEDRKENIQLGIDASFLEWVPFAPASDSWPPLAESLAESFVPALNEIGLVKKIFLPRPALGNNGIIEVGAHNYFVDGRASVRELNTQLALAHFPIRSRDQLISKLATKASAIRLKKNKATGESGHYLELIRLIVRTHFLPTLSDLQMAAASYATYIDKQPAPMVTISGAQSSDFSVELLPSFELLYNDLAAVNLTENLYRLATELTDQLVQEFGIDPKVDRGYRVPFKK